jgi:uridine kinase
VGRTVLLGVAGGTGSGKSTVASEIARRVGAERITIVNQDRYYRDLSHLDSHRLGHHNFDRPSAIETDLMVAHLRLLKEGRPTPLPVYDFSRHVRSSEVETVEPGPVVLVEGILVLADERLRELLDIRVYVDTEPDLRFIRRLQRDLSERGRSVESVISQYLETVRPMHVELVGPSKRWADVIIPEGGHNKVAMDLVASRVEQLLASPEATPPETR